jgi:hypothetical protein
MKIVYICHPVAGDVMDNMDKIINIIKEINLTCPDVVPFAPYLGDVLALNDIIPFERERGIRNCMAVLKSKMIDEIWIYGDRVSGGMEAEIRLAISLGIEVIVKDNRIPTPLILKL